VPGDPHAACPFFPSLFFLPTPVRDSAPLWLPTRTVPLFFSTPVSVHYNPIFPGALSFLFSSSALPPHGSVGFRFFPCVCPLFLLGLGAPPDTPWYSLPGFTISNGFPLFSPHGAPSCGPITILRLLVQFSHSLFFSTTFVIRPFCPPSDFHGLGNQRACSHPD